MLRTEQVWVTQCRRRCINEGPVSVGVALSHDPLRVSLCCSGYYVVRQTTLFALIPKCHFYCNKRDAARYGEVCVAEEGKVARGKAGKHARRTTDRTGVLHHTEVSRRKGGRRSASSGLDYACGYWDGCVRLWCAEHCACVIYHRFYEGCMLDVLRRSAWLLHTPKAGDAKIAFSEQSSDSRKHVIECSIDKSDYIFVILSASRPRIHRQNTEKFSLCEKYTGRSTFPKNRYFSITF